MAGDREKSAGEAAKEKVERREKLERAEEAADEAGEAAGEAAGGGDSAPQPEDAEGAAAAAKAKAEAAEKAAADAREGDETDQRSPQEREKDLAAGAVEPAGLKPTEQDSSKSSDELRDEVEAAREQLADTVEELGEKIDPRPDIEAAKQRAQAKAAETGQAAADNAIPIAAGVGFLVLILIWLRRR